MISQQKQEPLFQKKGMVITTLYLLKWIGIIYICLKLLTKIAYMRRISKNYA